MTGNDKHSSISSPEASEEPPRGRLFVFAGPSGVGKDTLIRELIGRWPFYLSVSATTRPPRPGEVDGSDYIFLTDEEFTSWVDEERFLEWARFSDHRYGTPRAAVEEQLAAGVDVLVEVEVQGAMQVKAIAPDATFIFVEPPSIEELEARLLRRGDTRDMEARLERARVEMAMADEFDHRVVNEVLSDAVAGLLSVVARPEGSHNDQPAD